MVAVLQVTMGRNSNTRTRYFDALGAIDPLSQKMDPNKVNGGVLLGLSGIVIKSHGGATAEGFCSAVEVGYDMVRNRLLEKIDADLAHFHHSHSNISFDNGGDAAN